MATEKWDGFTSRGTVLGSEIEGLVYNGRSNAGTEVNNSVNKDRYGVFEVSMTFAAAPVAGGYLELYMITAPDGTNYEDGSNTVDPGMHKLVDRIPVRSVITAQRLTGRLFQMLPAKTKFILLNGSGQIISSGSTVTLYTTNRTVA